MQKIKHWRSPQNLTGNIFSFGRVGGGKSCKLLTILQGLHTRGFKIFDIFGGKREEGPFWCFPSDDIQLWKQIEAETNEFKVAGPKQYKVNLIYPMFMSKLPKKLPQNPPNVISSVFTIPFKDLEDDMEQLISTVIGPLGIVSSRLWRKIIRKTKKLANIVDIENYFNKNPKEKNDKLYDSFFRQMIKEKLISSLNCPNRINLLEMAKDQETITVLRLDYVPAKFRYFIMGYILKKLFSLVKTNKIPKKNIALFREASLFMKVVDSDKNSEETTSIFRNILVDIARYCRSGLFLAMDTQDSSETRGMIEGSDDLLLICEMPSQKSREITCEPLRKDRRMTDRQIAYIGWKIKISEVCVVERGKKALILKRINPPRCRYWKSEYGDFNSLWRKEVNLYKELEFFIRDYENHLIEREKYFRIIDREPEIEEEYEEPKIEEKPLIEPKQNKQKSFMDYKNAKD